MTGGADDPWDAGFSARTRLLCLDCGGVYDPARGDSARGVPPGTPFARLPEHWTCPVCGAPPHRFAQPSAQPFAAKPDDDTGRLDALLAAYRVVGKTDMRGVAVGNPALGVEAVDFRPCPPGRIGCIVAPWFLNAVLMPEDSGLWADRRDGDTLRLSLPSGDYRFNAARMGALGTLAIMPLVSDMGLFAGPEEAREAAVLALDTLMRARPAPFPSPPPPSPPPPVTPGLSRRTLFGRRSE